MIKKENSAEIIEQGDIFFFYRPKIDTEEVEGIEDVQQILHGYLHQQKMQRVRKQRKVNTDSSQSDRSSYQKQLKENQLQRKETGP